MGGFKHFLIHHDPLKMLQFDTRFHMQRICHFFLENNGLIFPGSQALKLFRAKKKRSKKVPKNQSRKKLFDDPLFVFKKTPVGFPKIFVFCILVDFGNPIPPPLPVRSKGSVANGIPPSFDHWTPHQHLRCER